MIFACVDQWGKSAEIRERRTEGRFKIRKHHREGKGESTRIFPFCNIKLVAWAGRTTSALLIIITKLPPQ